MDSNLLGTSIEDNCGQKGKDYDEAHRSRQRVKIHNVRTNDCVNAAGALDYDFKISVIARSRSTLGSSPFCHGERFHVIVG